MRISAYICLCVLFVAPRACGNTRVVKNAEEFSLALKHSESGDTVCLENGVYSGQFEVSTPVVIIGDTGTIIDGQGIGNVLVLSADSIVLRNATVQNSGTRLLKDHAGILVTGNHVEIADCLVRDILHGIYVKAGNDALIRDNIIVGRQNIQEADRGNGIHLWNTTGNTLVNNDVSFARDGIYFSFAHRTEIRDNRIHHLRYGLHYMYSDSNIFEDNLFEYNVAGSALMYSKHISFKRNVFAHCRGFRAYGILLQSVDHCEATDNLILDNTRAIFLDDANYNRFESNDIVQNDLAVQINASCEENTFVRNNFISNLAEVTMDVSVMEYIHWSENDTGNFWSGYHGYDIDDDGIGDIPYQLQSVFEYLERDNPAVRFYLYSPASQLLAVAEKRLPIFRKVTVEDTRPVFRLLDNNEVPYDRLTDRAVGSSAAHLAIWMMVLVASPAFLWRVRK